MSLLIAFIFDDLNVEMFWKFAEIWLNMREAVFIDIFTDIDHNLYTTIQLNGHNY